VQSIGLHLLDTACVDAEAHIAMSSKRISVKLALHKVLLQLRAAIAQTRCSVHCVSCGQQPEQYLPAAADTAVAVNLLPLTISSLVAKAMSRL
jgi:hypothetical protein